MKKILKRIPIILSVVSIVLSIFSVPALAAEAATDWIVSPGLYNFTSPGFTPGWSGNSVFTDGDGIVTVDGNSYSATCYSFTSSASVFKGDTIACCLPIWFNVDEIDPSISNTLSFGIVVQGWSWEVVTVVPYTTNSSLKSIKGNEMYRLSNDKVWIKADHWYVLPSHVCNNVSGTGLYFSSNAIPADGRCLVVILLRRLAGSTREFRFYVYNESFQYDSPEAPNYTKPDTGVFDQQEQVENQLNNATASGMSDMNGTFQNFGSTLTGFVKGMLFVSNSMTSLIIRFPVIGVLLQISLGLGMFAFLVGIGHVLYSRLSSVSSEARWRKR